VPCRSVVAAVVLGMIGGGEFRGHMSVMGATINCTDDGGGGVASTGQPSSVNS
jgi:hypothetical protein